jgi:hypothetical protein
MKSYIVKLNKTEEYFQVEFNFYNQIEKLKFTKDKNGATIFQEDGNIIENERGDKLKIGNIRCTEFSFFLYKIGIKKEDVTIEIIDVPEQALLTKEQQGDLDNEIKTFLKNGG